MPLFRLVARQRANFAAVCCISERFDVSMAYVIAGRGLRRGVVEGPIPGGRVKQPSSFVMAPRGDRSLVPFFAIVSPFFILTFLNFRIQCL